MPSKFAKLWGGPMMPVQDEIPSRRAAVRHANTEFLKMTSMNDVTNIAEGTRPRRFFYTFWFFLAGGFFLSQAMPLFRSFYKKETASATTSQYDPDGFFIELTFCPTAAQVRCDCKLWVDLGSEFEKLQCYDEKNTWTSGPDPCGHLNPDYDYDSMFAEFASRGWLSELEVAMYGAHPFEEFVLDYEFGINATRDDEWTYFYKEDANQICWLFNPNSVVIQRRPIFDEGLNLLLDMNTELISHVEYELAADEHRMGIEVYVQWDEKSPVKRFTMTPGQSVEVALERKDIHFKEGYGESGCDSEVLIDLETCTDLCLANTLATECKCPDGLPENCPFTEVSDLDLLPQDALEIVECLFTNDVQSRFEKLQVCVPLVECKLACDLSLVSAQVTAGPWPNPLLEADIALKLNVTEEHLEKNVMAAQIYVTSFSFESDKESAKIDLANMIGNLGGLLGLWSGISLMTVAEMIEWAIAVFSIALLVPKRGTVGKVATRKE